MPLHIATKDNGPGEPPPPKAVVTFHKAAWPLNQPLIDLTERLPGSIAAVVIGPGFLRRERIIARTDPPEAPAVAARQKQAFTKLTSYLLGVAPPSACCITPEDLPSNLAEMWAADMPWHIMAAKLQGLPGWNAAMLIATRYKPWTTADIDSFGTITKRLLHAAHRAHAL